MRICILTFFEDLLLKDTGPTVRIYYLAKGLASLGHDVHIIIPSFRRRCKKVDGMTMHFVNGLFPYPVLAKLSKLFGVFRSASFFLYDIIFLMRISKRICESNILQIEEQETGGLLIPIVSLVFRKKTIVDCHDVLQALRIKHTNFVRRILETFFEKIAYKYSNAIVVVSESEKELLISYGINEEKIYVVPNGVDTKFFSPPRDKKYAKARFNLEDSPIVIFVGNMEYYPNKEALHLIASKIAPRVQKDVPNAKFLIVGRNRCKVKTHGLICTGVVKNVAELLAASDVAIAPLLKGTGTRLKVLEYFSCGLPVVSTSIGVNGLKVKDGVHAFVEDRIDNFAVKIIELLKNRQSALKIGSAARELVINNYDWNKIVMQLNRVCYLTLKGK